MSIESLIQNLTQCRDLLASVDEVFWSGKMDDQIKNYNSGKLTSSSVARNALSWYGGMGSLSDRIISQYNGDNVKKSQTDQINNDFRELLGSIYDNAKSTLSGTT